MQNSSSIADSLTTRCNKVNYRGTKLDWLIVAPMLVVLLPVFLINACIALVKRESCLINHYAVDALGRNVTLRTFRFGLLKGTAILFDIAKGSIAICGVGTNTRLSLHEQREFTKRYNMPSGLFSLAEINACIGLSDTSEYELTQKQANQSYSQYLVLMFKGLLIQVFFSNSTLTKPARFDVFGIDITNDSMESAVARVTADKPIYTQTPKTGFFINAHSVNLAERNASFRQALMKSDWRFADGSGMRVAAQSKGYLLKGNINGTDMLPPICQACVEKHKSIFLLGAAPGVAKEMANKLKREFPGLQISGVEHGFHKDYSDIVERINSSGTAVLLVAMGSPFQEAWINQHRKLLRCNSILAVGGLFDFYSGRIPRAPRWMREIGCEWLFRLYQEPIVKFSRYVIGTPEFLIRTFIFKQA
ncbi:WecB/TagA/CpsF family glycosyltransferase [Alteromonas sp. ASW11-36]|uniref:WecB/TagA/CpsF family glycosyltransferase n=1 Tax=Alteromonas arenosi TaxID=3055817 RepID=A0ABT7SSZ8_9ALTE|nr:WecB/TagA/CpsF family glycosyltransferase [Alteromonas sp. ASW11-36]MDM7859318.1 WecB/TagA/CpsF family glycosyltransferase [Alteromonas sp. ASW11-36]